jgi:hypothetical protein
MFLHHEAAVRLLPESGRYTGLGTKLYMKVSLLDTVQQMRAHVLLIIVNQEARY